MKWCKSIILVLSMPMFAFGSERSPRATDSAKTLRPKAKTKAEVSVHPFVFLSGPKSVIVPCVEEASSRTVEEALLISSTSLAQKEFFCVDIRKTTDLIGLKMCKDGSGNDLVLGATSSKIECLKLLDSIIGATVESKKSNNPSSP